MPGRAPPRFCCRSRSARPMLAPAGRSGSGPRQPTPAFSRICSPIGPLTMTTGNALPEAAWSCSLPDSSSRNASTDATRPGRYSGRPPAIASAMAQLSMVVTPPRGGKAPSSRRRGCAEPRRIQSTRSRVGGQAGRPSLQRLASITSFARANASSTLDACTRIIGCSCEGRAPLLESVLELLLVYLDRRDVAAGQEHCDRKRDHRRVGRQPEAGDRVRHDADEILAGQRDGRNAFCFEPSGRPAACSGAGPSGRVADDDRVDAALLDEGGGLFGADQGVALREGVDGQHLDTWKVRLEQLLEERQHAVGLPLLVADE